MSKLTIDNISKRASKFFYHIRCRIIFKDSPSARGTLPHLLYYFGRVIDKNCLSETYTW